MNWQKEWISSKKDFLHYVKYKMKKNLTIKTHLMNIKEMGRIILCFEIKHLKQWKNIAN